MGNNNQKNNKRKNRPNWFDIKEQQLGEDFYTSKMSIEDLRKESGKILKDMAYRNIDYENPKYAKYFTDPVFVSVLMNSCYENWSYNKMTATGLTHYFDIMQQQNQQIPMEFMNVYYIHNMAQMAYNILYDGLNTVLGYITQYGSQSVPLELISNTLIIMTSKVIHFNKGMNYTFIVVDNKPRREYNNDEGTRYTNQGEVQGVPYNGDSR